MEKPLGEEVFNPLHKLNLGESVRDHLLRRPIGPLPPSSRFVGAGIYAIYYTGDFHAYRKIAQVDPTIPIYVGKAVPAGSRKGGYGLSANPGEVLYKRLLEHADSIKGASSNLKLIDFQCRYLLVDDIWIPLGESLLIEMFQPVWNIYVDGFGHHNQGVTRTGQRKSKWDTLHRGRMWAEMGERQNLTSAEQIATEVINYLNLHSN